MVNLEYGNASTRDLRRFNLFLFFISPGDNMTSKLKIVFASAILAASGLTPAQTLLNGSYDVAREFYKDYNAAFVAH